MFFLKKIYDGLKSLFLKILNIPLIGILVGYSLSNVLFEGNIPYLNTSMMALSLLQMATPIFRNNPLLNIKLILKQNLLSILKLTPIFLISAYAMQNVLSMQELLFLFCEQFGFSFFEINFTWEATIFSSLVTPLIYFTSHTLFPWIYCGQELTPNSVIENIIPLSDDTQLNFNEVLNRFNKACQDSNLTSIKLYIIPSPFLSAFAIGRSHSKSSVCINSGLINNIIRINGLNSEAVYRQINAILMHELGHILNNHVTKQLLLFTPLNVVFYNNKSFQDLVGMAFSRKCEYEADNHAAKLGHSQDLIDGLKGLRNEPSSSQPISNIFLSYFQSAMIEIDDTIGALKQWNASHPTNLNRYENLKNQLPAVQSAQYVNPLSILVSEKDYVENSDDEEYIPLMKNKNRK